MHTLRLSFCTALFGLMAIAANGAETETFLMSIPGVTGESTTAGYAGWISLNDFSFVVSNNAAESPSGLTVGKGSCQALQLGKLLDSTSPILAAAVFGGTIYPTITIAAVDSGTVNYQSLTLTLTNVVIGSITLNGSTTTKVETISLIPTTIQVNYVPLTATGTTGTSISHTINCTTGVVS
jgi:type VI protein secretion system component Hcp